MLEVFGVALGVVGGVGHKHRDLDDLVEAAAGFVEDGGDRGEGLAGLGGGGAATEDAAYRVVGGGVTGDEDEACGDGGAAEGARGGGGLFQVADHLGAPIGCGVC